MTGSTNRIGWGAALVLALAGATTLQARPTTDEPVRLCELLIDEKPVPVQAEPIAVSVRHSASFGDTVLAYLPAESRIRVLGVAHAGKDAPQTLRVTLNTSEAVPGAYELVVDDGQAECRGTIRVGAASTGQLLQRSRFLRRNARTPSTTALATSTRPITTPPGESSASA